MIELCFSGNYTKEEVNRKPFSEGGVRSYLGTHDIAIVVDLIARGNEEALLVLQGMAYQISKDIYSMAAVLEGKVDGVVMTGNLCRAQTLVNEIKNRVPFLGKILIYPGEEELESLALGGYLVLTMNKKVKEYY